VARYTVVGTKAMLTAGSGYEYSKDIHLSVTREGKTDGRMYSKRESPNPTARKASSMSNRSRGVPGMHIRQGGDD
jgi:hypothetical protein